MIKKLFLILTTALILGLSVLPASASVIYSNDFNSNADGWIFSGAFSWGGSYLNSTPNAFGLAYYFIGDNDNYALQKIKFVDGFPSAYVKFLVGPNEWSITFGAMGSKEDLYLYAFNDTGFDSYLGSINDNEWHQLGVRWQINNGVGYICAKLDNNQEKCTHNDVVLGEPNEWQFIKYAGGSMLVDDVEWGSGGGGFPTPTPTPTPTPKRLTNDLVANVVGFPATLFNDLLPLLVVIIGLAFGFWVIEKLIKLTKSSFKK
jgi:hypothetical protein